MTAVVQFQAPRLPYHEVVQERFGVDKSGWKVLAEAVFPAAESPDSIVMALAYCKARNLDIFKKPVQIVPIWDKKRGKMVDTVWPGISELRTTAMRTGSFAGFDETEFGPMIDAELSSVKVSYPEWAQCIVYRLVGGQRVAFIGPKVFWIETYATAKKDSKAPNAMWAKRPRGQLEKCAEAAALRRAFPEELGNDIAAEEIAPFGSLRDVTDREAPNLHARLSAPTEGTATEGFTANHPLGDDQIPEFDAETGEVAETAPAEPDTSFPGDAPSGEGAAEPPEPKGNEEKGSAADLLTWHRRLMEDMDGLSLEQLDFLLGNPSDQEVFAELERDQPQLAMDLNKAITRRRKELA
jgi:phage recombination protein Bet